jgi:hypothetical protein
MPTHSDCSLSKKRVRSGLQQVHTRATLVHSKDSRALRRHSHGTRNLKGCGAMARKGVARYRKTQIHRCSLERMRERRTRHLSVGKKQS